VGHFMGMMRIRTAGIFRRWPRLIVFCALVLLLNGCATLPRMVKLADGEQELVAQSFEKMRTRQDSCHCCIDVAVTVTLKGLLHSGMISGYLQAMSPAYLRFSGLNPLGQPLMILVSDGERFQYLAVDRAKGYVGNVQAETFVKYAPTGFLPHESFYWLSGRLPPGSAVVKVLGRAADSEGYWLTVQAGEGRRRLLFDPEAGVILRHQVLNADGDDVLDAHYESFRASGVNGCLLPGRITVTTKQHRGTLEVLLSDWLDDAALSEKDFSFSLPPGFELVEVP